MKHKRVAALLASSLRVAMTKKSPKSMFINVYTFSLTFSWLPFKENICYRAYENHIQFIFLNPSAFPPAWDGYS